VITRRWDKEVSAVWRLTMFLLCLIAALSGTPLRQAEAASDFARSHSEIGQGHVIGITDGGVGDDSGATILKAGGDTHPYPAMILLAPAAALLTPFPPASSLPNLDIRRSADRLASVPAGSAQRHAWLQCFLF
jgi:hypothetical protein